jgi:dTDP-4-amino-4,6-dideoxygalactose transaminase
LAGVAGIGIPQPLENVSRNGSYFPVLVGPDYPLSRDALYDKLKSKGILAGRYFYPLISEMPMYRGLPSAAPDNLPVAHRVARQVLCLPIFSDLTEADQARIIELVRGA